MKEPKPKKVKLPKVPKPKKPDIQTLGDEEDDGIGTPTPPVLPPKP